jgi:hypothetical protein
MGSGVQSSLSGYPRLNTGVRSQSSHTEDGFAHFEGHLPVPEPLSWFDVIIPNSNDTVLIPPKFHSDMSCHDH